VESEAFVAELELADPPKVEIPAQFKPTVFAADKDSAFIVDGALTSFVAGVEGQQRADMLNSFLLAQLAASKKFDREENTREWYTFYRTVLENVGWVVSTFSFTKFNASGGSFTCSRAVIDILATLVSGNKLAVVAKTLEAMRNLSDNDGRIRLFERSSHSLHKGNFQVAIASNQNGALTTGIVGFDFSSSQDITRILWFSWETASSSLYHAGQTITLNTDVYSRVRQQIIDKLGDRASQFVAELEI